MTWTRKASAILKNKHLALMPVGAVRASVAATERRHQKELAEAHAREAGLREKLAEREEVLAAVSADLAAAREELGCSDDALAVRSVGAPLFPRPPRSPLRCVPARLRLRVQLTE